MGQFIGEGALAAVGSSYTLMTFLTSILLGLCMGSSVYFSIQFGRQDPDKLRSGIFQAFFLIGAITLVLNALVYALVDPILWLLQIPPEVTGLTKTYLLWVFAGIVATFLYNFFANLLRAVGNSVTPLLFLGISVVLNIGLDLLFVVPLQMGVQGAALATVMAQTASFVVCLWYVRRHQDLFGLTRRGRDRTGQAHPDAEAGHPQRGADDGGGPELAGHDLPHQRLRGGRSAASGICAKIKDIALLSTLALYTAATTVIAQCLGRGSSTGPAGWSTWPCGSPSGWRRGSL